MGGRRLVLHLFHLSTTVMSHEPRVSCPRIYCRGNLMKFYGNLVENSFLKKKTKKTFLSFRCLQYCVFPVSMDTR